MLKDGRGREIEVGDRIKRVDDFCFGFYFDRDGKKEPAVAPPAGYERVTALWSNAVQTQRSCYCAETLISAGPDEPWPE